MSSTAIYRIATDSSRSCAGEEPVAVRTSLGTVSLRITGDIGSLQGLWQSMQAGAPCAASQTFDWARAWAAHALQGSRIQAVIVVGYATDGTPLFLWPFEMGPQSGMRVLKWLSEDHANYSMGLFAPHAARGLTRSDLLRLLKEVGRRTGAAAALLEGQPLSWEDVPNPFARLRQYQAPNRGYAVKLGDFSEIYQKRFSKRSRNTLDRKERRLGETGTLDYGWAETGAQKAAVLEAFFAQKAKQFAANGVANMFDDKAQAFYRHLANLDEDNPSRLRLGYVALNGAVLATFNGFLWQDRMEVALSSLAPGETQRFSPGALLLRHQIKSACDAGLTYYDLGAGKARHKDEWCAIEHELFDSFVALKPQGLLVTLPRAAATRLKRAIKSNRALWSFVQAARKRLRGRKH